MYTYYIRLSQKCLSSTNMPFATIHLCMNIKPDLSNVMVFILIEQNGSDIIQLNDIKQKMLCIYCFFVKRKKLLGQLNRYT